MGYPIHPDDEESPRFGGWADDFNTYEEACHYYGCDTPAMLRFEDAADLAAWREEQCDAMEARDGPVTQILRGSWLDDELPF